MTERETEARSHRQVVAVILLIALGVRLFLLFYAKALEEDFYITLRYAENLAQRNGLVYNVGQRVLGTTTPLYTLWLSLAIVLHLNPIAVAQSTGVVADLLTCLCLIRLCQQLKLPHIGYVTALCVALAPVNLIWASKGMEAGVVALVGVAVWMFYAEGRQVRAWACAALLVLLRIDGVAVALVLLCASLWRERRLPFQGIFVFCLLILPWGIFATLYFGSPVPVSMQAKLVVYGWGVHERLPNVLPLVKHLFGNPFGAIIGIGNLAFIGKLFHKKDESRWLLFPLTAMLIHYAGMGLSKVFLFGWYFVPPTPLLYLFGCLGWSSLLAGRYRGDYGITSMGAVLALSAVMGIFAVPRVATTLRRGQEEENRLRIPIGLWLKEQAKPNERVMLEPIGYIGYYSGMEVLDTVGLVSPEVLPFYRTEIASPYHGIWTHFKPEWILLRTGEGKALRQYESVLPKEQRLEAGYRFVKGFGVPEGGGEPAFALWKRR